jgi:lysophospholipase L1-like esterase
MKKRLLSSVLVLVCVGFFCPALSAHSANDPAPRSGQGWEDRHQLINRRVAEAGLKSQIIFIGDSITQGWEGSGKEVWEHYYAGRNALNLGIGGDRTQHVLWRLENGNLKGLQPKAAVVMIGTNNSNGEDNTPGQIVDGVTAIVDKLRTELPDTKVLLVAIFPRSENYSAQRGKLAMINQVLRKAADNQNVFWIDFGQRFLNKDGTIPGELMPDYLHLSEKGYGIWAEAMERRVSTILGDTPVKPLVEVSASFSGDWIWTMDTPNGETSAALILKQEGNRLTGRFSRDGTRWLEIEQGRVDGDAFSWIVKRDRPDGGAMIYRMSGKRVGNQISAVATTEMDGAETKVEWVAKRK